MNEWNDIAVIAPAHDIDIVTVPLLREQVDSLLEAGLRRILVNCQGVSFIDSTGLAFLLSCARRLAKLGGLLSLVNASAYVVRFLQIARLIDALHVTAADKPPIPVQSADESPRWSKTLSVSEGIENLPYYRHRVSEMLSDLPLSAEARFDTALAAGEALSNAYDHACGCSCSLTMRAYRDRVVIEVSDRGCGFEIADDEEVEASEFRGRGIKLMRMLVDSVEVIRRQGGHGTTVRLIKMTRQSER